MPRLHSISGRGKYNPGFIRLSARLEPGIKSIMEKGFFVFGDRQAAHQVYGYSDSTCSLLSAVDFKKYYLVSIHQGLCPTGGYSIRVLQVTRTPGKIHIVVEFNEPSPGDIVTTAMTTPHTFIMIPREKQDGESPVFLFLSPAGEKLSEKRPAYVCTSRSKRHFFNRNGGGE